jgi:hypothetical protein
MRVSDRVLKWTVDGCPAGVMQNYTYKATAEALPGRRLITVNGEGGSGVQSWPRLAPTNRKLTIRFATKP